MGQLGITVDIIASFDSALGFTSATLNVSNVVPQVGNMHAMITATNGINGCGPTFKGSGSLETDTAMVPFSAVFYIDTIYDPCANSWDTTGHATGSIYIDNILIDAGAKVHTVYESWTGHYSVMEINATAAIGGVSTTMFYNLSSGQFDAFLDVKTSSLEYNTTLHSRHVDCVQYSNQSQFDGVGLAQLELPYTTPIVLSIYANYSACTQTVIVTGRAETFEAFGVIIQNGSFVVQTSPIAWEKRSLRDYSITGTVSGSAQIAMGSMFGGSQIDAIASFTGDALQYLRADVRVNNSMFTLDLNILYNNVICNATGAVFGTGSGTLLLHFADQDWLIIGRVTIFRPCNMSGTNPISVVEGYTQLNGTSIGGFPLLLSAYVIYTTYTDGSNGIQLWSHATYLDVVADLYVAGANVNNILYAPRLDVFQFSANITDDSGYFTLAVKLDYSSDCATNLNLINLHSTAYFTLAEYGSFSWKLLGLYTPCAEDKEIQYYLEGSADYQAPLTISGVSMLSPSFKVTGTKHVSKRNTTIWDIVIRAKIGAQFMEISEVDVYASLTYGTVLGLGTLSVQMTFQNALMLLSINIGYMTAAAYPCATIHRGPNWSLADFNPTAEYFQGGFGTADLILTSITPEQIEIVAQVAYDACLDVWWINGKYALVDGEIQGLGITADLDIVILGVRHPGGSFTWSGRLSGNAYIPSLDLNATVTIFVDSDNGLDYIELSFSEPTNIGTIDLDLKYSHQAPNSSAVAQPGSSCRVGETQSIAGTGNFNLKLADGSSTRLSINFESCFYSFSPPLFSS